MRHLIAAALSLVLAGPALAQQAPPDGVAERRVAISRDVDFYGSDLSSIFDTTLDGCQAACMADTACMAFTYNTAAASCFPKSGVSEVRPFPGGISGRVLDTDPSVLAQAAAIAARMTFLQDYDLEAAETLGREIGRVHSSDEVPVGELLDRAAEAESFGDAAAALAFTGAALALTDEAGLWRDYARLTSTVQGDDEIAYAARARAVPAALAATLRGEDDEAQAQGLVLLAQALEAEGRTRETLPALRLAASLSPAADVAAALDRVVGLYGFNVVETQVESDAAQPRVCFLFNEPLQTGLDYSPYVRLDDATLAVTARDSQLCVEGVVHGQTLSLTLREGLPAASGETLAASVDLRAYVRDRAPAVRVLSRAYVLPRGGDAAIPVETVNLAQVAIRLARVNDANLVRALAEGSVSAPLYNWEQDFFEDNLGTTIYEGVLDVPEGDLNADTTTSVPLGTILEGRPAGVYALSAAVPDASLDETPATSQWFVLTDLGLATYQGDDGLTVAVRSLGDAGAVVGAEVRLTSRANGTLGTAVTDADGIARFAAGLTRGTGGDAPALVTAILGDAEAPTDMAFLSLLEPAFDLSDRGVEGREPGGPIDVFLATDRGAYRAGETVHATALLRDARVAAVDGLALTAILTRPDGVEYARIASAEGVAGGHVFALPISSGAPRGTWTLAVQVDPEADEPLAETAFLVEDFVPERVDVILGAGERARLGEVLPVAVEAEWLFGAPAGDLGLEGEVTLRAATLEDWPGYAFGRVDAPFEPRMESFSGTRTDADGRATLSLALPTVDEGVDQPLEAIVTVRAIEASGRPVERSLTLPVAPDGALIGIQPPAEVVDEGATARINVVGLGPDLTPVPMQVRWSVERLETRYQWYALDGAWNWEPTTSRTRVATGEVTLGNGPGTIEVPVGWGQYEVSVERIDGEAGAASTTFSAGWYAVAGAEAAPDRLDVSLDAERYASGDTARLRIDAEVGGTALVSVLAETVVALRVVEVPAGGMEVELPVTDEWGAGVYVAAELLRPVGASGGAPVPVRALGLAHAAVDPGARALAVSIEAPEATRPRGPLPVAVQVDGIAAGSQAYVTLAAVDVGILNLTRFEAPDPAGHYFGQRRLGMELRDLYGRLIEPMGVAGTLREGGDAMAMGTSSPPPTEELLALFAGPVEVDANGRAEIALDLPAFDGSVRLMAIAWSPEGVGGASRDVTVADPVVVTASLPRVLSPGDESRLRLDLTLTEGAVGPYALDVTAQSVAVAAGEGSADLREGAPWRGDFALTAPEAGVGAVAVAVTTPSGERIERTYAVPVTARDPAVARTARFTLAPGEAFTFDDAVLAGFAPGSAEASLSVGPLARLDAAGLLVALDRVPYGCTEQMTSQALPLLYLSDVAEALDLGARADIALRVEGAIGDVLANQASNGAFGLWGPYEGDLWLDAYVTDFLSRARAAGYAVPDVAFAMAMGNLSNQAALYPDFEAGGEDLAYALLVLAREGEALIGDLRYFADAKAKDFATPLALAQLGAALAAYGDQPRADALFARAGAMIDAAGEEAAFWRVDYGTARRDAAAVLTLAVEAGSLAVDRARLTSLLADRSGEPASTQEAAWTLLAAAALVGDVRETGVTIDGTPPTGPIVRRIAEAGAPPVLVANDGPAEVELTVTAIGVPSDPVGAEGNGWTIERSYYALDGTAATPEAVAMGTRLVTVLTVTPLGYQAGRLMVEDPLPGGFEIDNPNLLRSGDVAALPWLAPVAAAHTEARSDRFLAAVDWQSDQSFQVAFIVRAVSPGSFHHPAASVQDMYRPALRAQTDPGRVTVAE